MSAAAKADGAAGRSKGTDLTVVRQLSKDGNTTVQLVRRKQDGRLYALKRVKATGAKARDITDALAEIKVLVAARHTNVVTYVDAFFDEKASEVCILTESVDGQPLTAIIDTAAAHAAAASAAIPGVARGGAAAAGAAAAPRSLLDEELIWSVLTQLLSALAAIHKRKLVHRDIQPANLLLSRTGCLKLAEFPILKLAKYTRAPVGNPSYTAPQAFKGQAVDARADVYSAGCCIYELAALHPPFRGRDLDDLKQRVLRGVCPSLPSVYSPQLQSLVAAMIQGDPKVV